MTQFYLAALLLLLAIAPTLGQNTMRREDKIKVVVNGDTLRNPWAGGLHAPQFSEADIDGDGHNDLVVFNRGMLASSPLSNGFKLLTFRNNGTPNQVDYTYMPEWEAIFPPLVFWVKLYDLNCDNIPDLLSSNQTQSAFFNWYQGYRKSNGMIYFEYRDTLITSDGFAPVGLERADYPGIGDVNRDGDIDFINCNSFFGVFNYYESSAMETKGTCGDSIGHEMTANCWGEVALVASGIQTGYTCLFTPLPVGGGIGGGRHNGGAALVIDLDGDGDDDLIYGEVDKKNLFALYNGGDSSYAIVDSVDDNFPSYDVPAIVSYYPLAFGLDVNNDGKKDVLVAPNEPFISSSKNSVLFYQNISPNDSVKLQLVQNDFLEDGMVDLGIGAFPTFVDYNGDSLMDLVVGNYGYFRDSTVFTGQLALFINIGTPEVPIFELADDDWLNLSAWYPAETIMAFRPVFGDIDGDGDLDLFVGDTTGTLTFYENTAGVGNVMAFAAPVRTYMGINSGKYSAPYVFDVNADGLPDLLVGNRAGFIRYYENRGTTGVPLFDPVPTNFNFGNINVSTQLSLFGYAGPVISPLDSTGKLYLLSGNEEGRIYGYDFDIDSIYSGTFTQVFDSYADIDAGERTAITIADITNDGKPEMIVGNHRGGLEFFTLSDTIENIISAPSISTNGLKCSVYPNPSTGEVFLQVEGLTLGQPIIYSVHGLLGNTLLAAQVQPMMETWAGNFSIAQLPAGLYVVRVQQGAFYKTIKLIKQ